MELIFVFLFSVYGGNKALQRFVGIKLMLKRHLYKSQVLNKWLLLRLLSYYYQY